MGQCYDHSEAKSPAMERAKVIQANLTPYSPSFIKVICPSHITNRFRIKFPKEFCSLHLPAHDTPVSLVNERGDEYSVNVHVEGSGNCGLSCGWKKFSIANKLREGDVLVCQMLNSSKFKIYIVRANGLVEDDGAPGFQNEEAHVSLNDCYTIFSPGKDDSSRNVLSVREQSSSDEVEKSSSHKRKRSSMSSSNDHSDPNSPVMQRAKEIQTRLAPETPSFIKAIFPSHITQRFGIKFPREFCSLHLPRHDTTIRLLDESNEEYIVNIHVEGSGNCGLSGGWKKFVVANKLMEGDVLIFQLISPSKFKIYIVRANGLTEGVRALGPNLDVVAHHDKNILSPIPLNFVQNNTQQEDLMIDIGDPSEIGNDYIGSRATDIFVDSKEMGSIENFTIFLNGSIINSELSEYHITKYYELCCAHNSYLHSHLLKTITCKLAAEIISESVNIADAIRACKLSTSQAEYLTWDKTLEGFELLGMDVGFLRAKISRLMTLAFESKEALDIKRFREAKIQQSCAEEEIKALELKLLGLKKMSKKLDLEMRTLRLKANTETHELLFHKEVNAPWL